MELSHGFKQFLKSESFVGVLLLSAVILATLTVNSSFSQIYHNIFNFKLSLDLSWFGVHKKMDIRMWINDALMAVFFLLIGLELKREFLLGELSSLSKVALPAIGAIGGVIFPALIYFYFNVGNSLNLRGWAIPTATDIAFAIGIISFFGNKISNSLKVFLVTLAVIDDVIAILIIAFFYTSELHLIYLNIALLITAFLFLLNKLGISSISIYLFLGSILWICVLKSGIHATIAGIILAFTIPLKSQNGNNVLTSLEHKLHLPVNYLILPIFAFANSGISLDGISLEIFQDKLVIAIALGLFLGKQFGICSAVFLAVKLRIVKLFSDISLLQFYGVSILAGIGFTMSLFIGGLAFDGLGNEISNKMIVGVIIGSFLSMLVGIIVISISIVKRKNA